MQQHYLKNIFEGVWDGTFERSEQVKSAKFIRLVPPMVAPPGQLNSWNQCMNDHPLYQSLFEPLVLPYAYKLNPLFIVCLSSQLFAYMTPCPQ